MRRILVVANQTVASPALWKVLKRRVDAEASFHVVVPATGANELARIAALGSDPLAGFPINVADLDPSIGEHGARTRAKERLDSLLENLRNAGADATGEVGDEDPTAAIAIAVKAAELEKRRFDEIVLSTLPAGMSKWLSLDLPKRVERKFGLPVRHVESLAVGDEEYLSKSATFPRPASQRISLVTNPTDLQKELMQSDLADQPLNIMRTLAHNTRVLKRFNALGGSLLFRGTLPARERELVILRVGANCKSVYEFGQHTIIGRDCGITDLEIAKVCQPLSKHDWSPGDLALLKMADELCADNCVSDPTWALLAAKWSEEQLVELLIVAGFYRMVSGFLNSAGVQLDAGVPGWPASAAT